MHRPVTVQITVVSKNTPVMFTYPWRAGLSVAAEAAGMAAEPMPASWGKAASGNAPASGVQGGGGHSPRRATRSGGGREGQAEHLCHGSGQSGQMLPAAVPASR